MLPWTGAAAMLLLASGTWLSLFGSPRDYRLRLAGTGLYGVYGREITGKSLNDVYAAPAASAEDPILAIAAHVGLTERSIRFNGDFVQNVGPFGATGQVSISSKPMER